MTQPECRAFDTDLEVRSDGRTIVGIAVPYGEPADIWEPGLGQFTEQFVMGAFARTIAERGAAKVKFMVNHESRALPIGRATLLREDTRGLYGEFRVSATEKGDEVLTLAADGVLTGLSVGFGVIRDQWSTDRSQRTVQEARLDEVSAVNFQAYQGAQISAVRAAATPVLNAAYMRLELLKKVSP